MSDSGLSERFPALRGLTAAGRRRRIPVIQQNTATDCGAACLTMVLHYHGKQLRIEEVRDVVGPGRDGAAAQALLRAGEWFGLRGRGVKVPEIDNLRYLPKGSILHWQFHHYVVLEAPSADGARIVDPSSGRRRVSREQLRQSFTGVALTFEPSDDFEAVDGVPRGIGRYLRQLVRRSHLLSRVVVVSMLLQLLALATPILTGLLVDRVVPRGDGQLLSVLAAGLAAIVVFYFLSSLIRAHLLLHLRTHLDAHITLEFLEHLVELPYAFFQRRSAGDLMMRLNSNSMIREILTSGALSGLLDGALVGIYLLLLLITHAPLGLLVLLLGLLRVILFLLTRRRQADLMAESLQVEARSRSYQVQMLAGIETLKVMGAERRAVEHWSNLFVDELNVSLARGRLNAVFDSLLAALELASPFVILIYGGFQVLEGSITLGTLLAMNALAVGFLTPLSTLVSTAVQLQLMGSYLERIDDVLETPREQDQGTADTSEAPGGHDQGTTGEPGLLSGRIQLEEVSFRYAAATPLVVREVSVEIEPGSFVAIVGASGAGKSTLACLCLGLYAPTTGRILYDGKDLATLDLRSLRSQIGIVTQQPYLFGTSVRGNITLADPTLPLSRVVEAARLAHIHNDILAMPMGYETPIADGGSSLSGGQRQRLALARALVHRPAILLLDEATSNLDAVTEQQIQQELERLQATRLVIAHRLSTVMAADLILVMAGGRIVEQGRHDELVALGGRYSELVAAQVQGEDTATEGGQ